jgi:hypothetical protein
VGARVKTKPRFSNSVPREPLVAWMQERVRHYENIQKFALACGVSERWLRRLLNGYEMSNGKVRPVDYVSLDKVDEILINEGSTMLWEIYPMDDADAA